MSAFLSQVLDSSVLLLLAGATSAFVYRCLALLTSEAHAALSTLIAVSRRYECLCVTGAFHF